MNKVGIIAEYNPFHNGHKYQLDKVKEELNPEAIIVVMSSETVQRGAFASFDKYFRAEKALNNGADLVIALPSIVSSQGADYFARGAIDILNSLDINTLVFGTESQTLDQLDQVADFLAKEPLIYKTELKSNLNKGLSFPKAREEALIKSEILEKPEILRQPNNILALEYLKTIKEKNYSINAFNIPRKKVNYHSLDIQDKFASASAIREALKRSDFNISKTIPYSIKELKKNYISYNNKDIYKLLQSKLLLSDFNDLIQIEGITEDLANKLLKVRFKAHDLKSLNEKLKSKDITQTRINRVLLNLLTNIKKEDLNNYFLNSPPYIQVLGMNPKGQKVLNESKIPVISTFSKDIKKLDNSKLDILNKELEISNFRTFLSGKEIYNKDYYMKPIIKDS